MRPGQPPTSLGTLPSPTPTQSTKQKPAETQATMYYLDHHNLRDLNIKKSSWRTRSYALFDNALTKYNSLLLFSKFFEVESHSKE